MSLGKVLELWGGVPEAPMDLYADLFKLGDHYIQQEGEPPADPPKTNPIIIGQGDDGQMYRKILFEDRFAETLQEFSGLAWAFISPCTYFGRKNDAEHQSRLFGIAIDLDGVTDETLNNFLSGAIRGDAYPVPQHIVLSGHGVHLYYVFEEPLSLYPEIKVQVKALKYALIDRIWNHYTSKNKAVQHQGINQGFRVPGTRTKVDARRRRAVAYRLNQHPTSVELLNEYVPSESQVDMSKHWRRKCTREEARRRWPEWAARVLDGEGEQLINPQWVFKEDLYKWWLRKIREGAAYGRRYFCIMDLAIFAAKCNLYDKERVRADAMQLVPYLNDLSPQHPFTDADVDSALECLDWRYVHFPRDDMSRLAGIPMPANKRNYRDMETHQRVRRAVQQALDPEGSWRNKDGAPKKVEVVRDYIVQHPEANHSEVARALGISRTTVIKWSKEVAPDA